MAIEQTSINMNGKWELANPLTIAKLQTETAAFLADTTMGLAKNEQKKTELRIPVYVFDKDGNEKGFFNVTTSITASYEDAIAHIENDMEYILEMIAGTDAEAERAADEETWTVTFSCEKADDPFQMIFHKDCLIIQNYSNTATKTALETYFATRPDLAQAS